LSAGPLLALDVPTTKDGPGRFILIRPKREKALSTGPLLALDVPTTKDGPGRFILIQPKREKALSAGPLLALDVPTTKDGPGRFILICPMLHVYQPKEVIAMNLSQIPQQESALDCSMQCSLMAESAALGECAVCCLIMPWQQCMLNVALTLL
jgi:hypothetical protein